MSESSVELPCNTNIVSIVEQCRTMFSFSNFVICEAGNRMLNCALLESNNISAYRRYRSISPFFLFHSLVLGVSLLPVAGTPPVLLKQLPSQRPFLLCVVSALSLRAPLLTFSSLLDCSINPSTIKEGIDEWIAYCGDDVCRLPARQYIRPDSTSARTSTVTDHGRGS